MNMNASHSGLIQGCCGDFEKFLSSLMGWASGALQAGSLLTWLKGGTERSFFSKVLIQERGRRMVRSRYKSAQAIRFICPFWFLLQVASDHWSLRQMYTS
ncbi:hypothetical protein J3458_003422 [Metarhizium acridum]|uniref:uncharacterized protein n=1 Tax=Metarhizium acridum TaxID=92637 RepID=UPI001C6CA544|nr:hypothetical protein J3458_003422 [Metarhizium acridum]